MEIDLPDWPPNLSDSDRDRIANAVLLATRDKFGKPVESVKSTLETEIGSRFGVQHVIATNSGTSALDLCIDYALTRKAGVVIASNYGHPSSVRMAAARGKLLLVDIDPDTLCIDPEAVERAHREMEVAAVVATHVAGQPAAMALLRDICKVQSSLLIEDAAHAHGAQTNDGFAGALGDAGCFSFHWTKTVPAGEGGAICTGNELLFDYCWRAHDLGHRPESLPYDFIGLGGNFRMSEANCAAALANFHRLEDDLTRKNSVLHRLREKAGPDEQIFPLPLQSGTIRHGLHFLPLRIHKNTVLSHRKVFLDLLKRGISCSLGWPRTLDEIVSPRAGVLVWDTPAAKEALKSHIWVDQRVLLSELGAQALELALAELNEQRRA